jgi:hypothetical protein
MGRSRSRNEDHFLKLEGLSYLLRPPEVTQMDGVECPPKKTDPSFARPVNDLRTLRLSINSKNQIPDSKQIPNAKCNDQNALVLIL